MKNKSVFTKGSSINNVTVLEGEGIMDFVKTVLKLITQKRDDEGRGSTLSIVNVSLLNKTGNNISPLIKETRYGQ